MKSEIHPSNYRLVVFKDMSNGEQFLTNLVLTQKKPSNTKMVMNTQFTS
jgi:ribosomal protein L31